MEQVQIKFANLHKIITRNYLPLSHCNRAASCNHGGKSSFSVQLLSLETVPAAWDDLLISEFFFLIIFNFYFILKHLQNNRDTYCFHFDLCTAFSQYSPPQFLQLCTENTTFSYFRLAFVVRQRSLVQSEINHSASDGVQPRLSFISLLVVINIYVWCNHLNWAFGFLMNRK